MDFNRKAMINEYTYRGPSLKENFDPKNSNTSVEFAISPGTDKSLITSIKNICDEFHCRVEIGETVTNEETKKTMSILKLCGNINNIGDSLFQVVEQLNAKDKKYYQTHSRERNYDDHDIDYKNILIRDFEADDGIVEATLVIANSITGAIIGISGQNVKSLQQKCNCNINIHKNRFRVGRIPVRICFMSGKLDNVVKGIKCILEQILSFQIERNAEAMQYYSMLGSNYNTVPPPSLPVVPMLMYNRCYIDEFQKCSRVILENIHALTYATSVQMDFDGEAAEILYTNDNVLKMIEKNTRTKIHTHIERREHSHLQIHISGILGSCIMAQVQITSNLYFMKQTHPAEMTQSSI